MENLPKLTRTLKAIPARPERILQFGGGNFLRGFLDWMVQVMNEKVHFDAGIVVVQSVNQQAVDTFNAQDGLFTLCLTAAVDGNPDQQCVLIDAIQRSLSVAHAFEAFLATARQPEIRFIFSNTTEAGIVFDPADQLTDTPPASFPGKLTCWLWERFQYSKGNPAKGVIVLPCELVENNGTLLQNSVLQYATQWELPAEFSQWVQQSCFWCNTLVDRIVPGYPRERAGELSALLGYSDALLTEGEQFHLLVIEGPAIVEKEFPAPTAGLQVVFTQDITPYRTRKVRILNGAHTAMVPVAYLAGLRTVRETVEDPQLGPFVQQLIEKEIIPTLDIPREELQIYAREVIQRFRNPFIRHELRSIALYCTAKFVTRLLPSLLRYQQQTDQLPRHLVFALAALIRFYQGTTPTGETIPLQDEADRIAFFQQAWTQHAADLNKLVDTILGHETIWEQDLRRVPGLAALVTHYLEGMPLRGEHLPLPY